MITSSEDKRKHLDYIQSAINRMASNQFVTRGWSVTVLAGLLTIVIKTKNCELLLVSIGISILFWGIDSYYLSLERAFRDLYSQTIKLDPTNITYSMAIKSPTFREWLKVMFGRPIMVGFYGLITFLQLLIVVLFNLNWITFT